MKVVSDALYNMINKVESNVNDVESRIRHDRLMLDNYIRMRSILMDYQAKAAAFDSISCYKKILLLRDVWLNTDWSDQNELRDAAESVLLESIDDGSCKEVKPVYRMLSEFWCN